jgi:ATP-dependent RNA helicase DDX49/DBP8
MAINSKKTFSKAKGLGKAPEKPSSSDSSDASGSDSDISTHQNGSRKRRKLSSSPSVDEENDEEEEEEEKELAMKQKSYIPVQPVSRIQAKKTGLATQPSASNSATAAATGKEKTTFASIDVAPWLVHSLAAMEIKHPTGIQKACIPEILKGRDWYVCVV